MNKSDLDVLHLLSNKIKSYFNKKILTMLEKILENNSALSSAFYKAGDRVTLISMILVGALHSDGLIRVFVPLPNKANGCNIKKVGNVYIRGASQGYLATLTKYSNAYITESKGTWSATCNLFGILIKIKSSKWYVAGPESTTLATANQTVSLLLYGTVGSTYIEILFT